MINVDGEKMKAFWDKIGKRPDLNFQIVHIADELEFINSAKEHSEQMFGTNLSSLPAGNILEIGCGKGRLLYYLASVREDSQFFGIDVSSEMIGRAYPRSNIKYNVNNGFELLNYRDGVFDAVFSYIVFQHLPVSVTHGYFKEVARVLKENGLFVFQMQEGTNEKMPPNTDYRAIRYYTEQSVMEIMPDTLVKESIERSINGSNYFVMKLRRVPSGCS